MKVYAVMDKRTNKYKPPMFFEHVAECTRVMEQIVNNPESDLGKWPLDFQLNMLGEFDRGTGKFKEEQKEICQINDLIQKKTHETVDSVQEIRKIN